MEATDTIRAGDECGKVLDGWVKLGQRVVYAAIADGITFRAHDGTGRMITRRETECGT